MPCTDSRTIWACRHVTTDPVASADDPQQTLPLVIVDLSNLNSFGHADQLQ
jgi:hypothetical protein